MTFNEITMQSMKALVAEYRKPEAERSGIWVLLKGFMVNGDGELTEQGKAIVAQVEAEEEKAAAEAAPKKKKKK